MGGTESTAAPDPPPVPLRVQHTRLPAEEDEVALRSRTWSGGLRDERHVTPGLVPCYVLFMLLLPTSVFLVSSLTRWRQNRAELGRNSSAPVTYVNYYLEVGKAVEDMEADHIWVRVPSLNDSFATAVFASNTFWFQRGKGGYMGTQVWREGVTDPRFGFLLGGGVSHRAIFSIWDGDAEHQALPGEDAVSRAYCERFGGEGTGAHCSRPYPLQRGQKVTVRLERTGRGKHGDIWAGYVGNRATGEELPLGSIFVPDMAGHRGFGMLEPWNCRTAFQEYYRASGCEQQALSIVGIYGPYFDRRTLVPDTAEPAYKKGCDREDVSPCIPGFGCGRPRVLLSAGGPTLRKATDGLDVWGAADGVRAEE